MQKNVASQKLVVFAFDTTNNTAKTGDAANITAYVSIDGGAVTVLGDTSATELSSSNAAGYYQFDLTQAETNGNALLFTAKSSTANIAVVGVPAMVFTDPPNYPALAITAAGGITLGDGVSHGGTLGSSTATLALSRVNLTSQTADTTALTVAGNGTGSGVSFTGGATGVGVRVIGGGTSGNGITITVTDGDGIEITSAGSAQHAIKLATGNGDCINAVATGSGRHGINVTGGSAGNAINLTGGATSGHGLAAAGTGTGTGIRGTGGATGIGIAGIGGATSGSGVVGLAQSGTSHGASFTGVNAGHGIVAVAGSSGNGINTSATAGHGIAATGGGTGHGLLATSGSGATGNGIQATSAASNGSGIGTTGTGTGSGLAGTIEAITVTTYSMLGQAAPSATPTLAAAIMFPYKIARNGKAQTSSQWSLFADDGTTVDQKSAVADDGTTFTRGEVAAGP